MKQGLSGSMANELEVSERNFNDRIKAHENLRKMQQLERRCIEKGVPTEVERIQSGVIVLYIGAIKRRKK